MTHLFRSLSVVSSEASFFLKKTRFEQIADNARICSLSLAFPVLLNNKEGEHLKKRHGGHSDAREGETCSSRVGRRYIHYAETSGPRLVTRIDFCQLTISHSPFDRQDLARAARANKLTHTCSRARSFSLSLSLSLS